MRDVGIWTMRIVFLLAAPVVLAALLGLMVRAFELMAG